MHLTHLSLQGTGILNEDALVINTHAGVYGVLDGCSSLVYYRNEHNQTSGYLAAQLAKEYFESLPHIVDWSLHIREVNDLLAAAMQKENIDVSQKDSLWGTALALIHPTEHGVEFVQTGDCMIFAVYEDRHVRSLTHTQVDHLERRAFDTWKAGLREKLPNEQVLSNVKAVLKDNRYHSNIPGGYGVLNGEAAAPNFFEYGKINAINITHLVLLTDGLFLPPETLSGQLDPWREMVHQILERGLETYARELITLEESDPECKRYMRFKKSDDKTGLIIRL